MTNPYDAPKSEVTSVKPVEEAKNGSALRWLATGASVLAIAVFLIAAAFLIPQAMRLASENTGVPARFQSSNDAAIRASWMGGLAAVSGIVANIVGLVLIRARKARLSLAICGASIALMVAIAIAFKPS